METVQDSGATGVVGAVAVAAGTVPTECMASQAPASVTAQVAATAAVAVAQAVPHAAQAHGQMFAQTQGYLQTQPQVQSQAAFGQAQSQTVAATPRFPEQPHSGEVRLVELLGAMDQHMQQLRETQQGLVATVELACRRALGRRHFKRLELVGSAALRVETPGSDVDVVCFTRRDGPEPVGLPADVLRRVHWALTELISQYADSGPSFSMELIHDARVPILRVLWCPPGAVHTVAVDVSVDQNRPVDHVRWFQRVGAAPRPSAPPPAVAPLVTLTLRCAKWWLRQRQIPRTKEGGLPTLAWLLMAVHVCSRPETHEQAIMCSARPMVALLASLTAFFSYYSALDGLDGTLAFAADGSSSEFKKRTGRWHRPWAELSVLDPTREGAERLDLASRLHPASHLLLTYELCRASQRLEAVPRGSEVCKGQSRQLLDEVFEGLPEGTNELPSFVGGGLGALLIINDSSKGAGVVLELAIIDTVKPRPGWQAPFLHRSDERSELSAKILDLEDRTGQCHLRKPNGRSGAAIALAPCNFICRVGLEKDGRGYRVDAEGLARLTWMRQYIVDLNARHEQASKPVADAPVQKENKPPTSPCGKTLSNAPDLVNVPSPSRSETPAPRSRSPHEQQSKQQQSIHSPSKVALTTAAQQLTASGQLLMPSAAPVAVVTS